jgi:hypothetical protein
MKQKIKIKFTDFWDGFEDKNSYFYNLLAGCYEVEISDKPDFLFYSVFGAAFKEYDCVRIFYTGENRRPNFAECDYAFSFDYLPDNPRNYRLPNYALYGDCNLLLEPKPSLEAILREKKYF